MPDPPNRSFVSRNLVAIVMIPSIIGIHYCWNLMQKNKTLVTDEERIDLPPVTLIKYFWRSLQGGQSATGDNPAVRQPTVK